MSKRSMQEPTFLILTALLVAVLVWPVAIASWRASSRDPRRGELRAACLRDGGVPGRSRPGT